jgi:hypothetical protein
MSTPAHPGDLPFRQLQADTEGFDALTELSLDHGAQGSVRVEGRRGQQRRARAECPSDPHVQAGGLVDVFVSSCFVLVRKPDVDVFRLAIDLVHTPTRQVVYIADTPMFVKVAEGLGTRGILHTGARTTRARLASFGLEQDRGARRDP